MGAVEEPLAAARASEDAGSDVPQLMQAQLQEAVTARASEGALQHRCCGANLGVLAVALMRMKLSQCIRLLLCFSLHVHVHADT